MSQLKQPYQYENGYIFLADIGFGELPDLINANGYELHKKSEFHISLVCVKRLALIINEAEPEKVQAEIVELFEGFIADKPLEDFKLLPKFRFVERGDRKAVIVITEAPNLADFFELLRGKYDADLPERPTHITLYTLQPEVGIGIVSRRELESDSRPIEMPNLKLTKE
jgi:hypothetical protein